MTDLFKEPNEFADDGRVGRSTFEVILSYEKIDPETTLYDHHLIEVAKGDPRLEVFRVSFICILSKEVRHRGILLHLITKDILQDAIDFDLYGHFEDWIRNHVDEHGFPSK